MATLDQQFIEYIVKSLVEHPEDVQVDRSIDEKGVLLSLTVHPDDLGRVIGKRGVTAQSLRSVLRALGTKYDARYNLKIVNNDRDDGNTTNYNNDDDNNVDDRTSGTVENDSTYSQTTRKELAELDDPDI